MDGLNVRSHDGSAVAFSQNEVDALKSQLQGSLITEDSADYDEARAIWNAMIDRRPALIVMAESASDVAASVRLAAAHDLVLAIRGGGHNIAGNAVCDGGMMIHLGRMNSVDVDPESKTARVGPGATLGDLDQNTLAHGLAIPVGINSITGVAGLTLGGGMGWLTRTFGMTVDSLKSAEVVLASGEIVTANDSEHPELFWALRGGGGNFGVVTSFEFQLHDMRPNIMSGLIVYALSDARSVFPQYVEYCKAAPDELTVWGVLRKAPPLPFLPEEVHGTGVLVLAVVWTGDPDDAKPHLDVLRSFGTPVGEHLGVQPYVDFQQAFDPLLTPGVRNYWKSHDLKAITDETVDVIVRYAETVPTPHCEIFIPQLGGAASRVAADAMAYPHPQIDFATNVHARWENADDDDACITWARGYFEEMKPFSSGDVYVNFMSEDDGNRVGSAYGPNFARLAQIKAKYDPENLFRMNQNIRPA